MFYRLRDTLARSRFRHACRGILDTPPIRTASAPLTIVSQVSHIDVILYLLAIKSLYRRLGEAEIVVLDDGSLTEADRILLNQHIHGSTIVPIAAIDTGPCPRGGTWERLLFILDRAADRYVIQMDSDTLSTGPLVEVLDHIHHNRPFTLGTAEGRGVTTLAQAAERAIAAGGTQINVAAEQAFRDLPDAATRRYVRGSSGFAGFARGGIDRREIEAFSAEMVGLVGTRWTEWGTEQIASNYAVANSPGGGVLPHPAYACLWPGLDAERCDFIHFIGTYRFTAGLYARLGRRVIAELSGEISLRGDASPSF
jgi:hypothetical protein